jgi:hypothetical protein
MPEGFRGQIAMALRDSKSQPKVFLSYASDNEGWKTDFFGERSWSASLTNVADIYDYEFDPRHTGELEDAIKSEITASAAFIPIISDSYLRRNGIIEQEFLYGVEVYSGRGAERRLFYPILIDRAAADWWHAKDHHLFQKHDWLRGLSPLRMVDVDLSKEKKLSASLEARRFMTSVKESLEGLPRAKAPVLDADDAQPADGPILILGHPTTVAAHYAAGHQAIVQARTALTTKLRDQKIAVDSWDDGWLSAVNMGSPKRNLHEPWPQVVRPIGLDEAPQHVAVPNTTAGELRWATGITQNDASALKISLWLPRDICDDPRAKSFRDAANEGTAQRAAGGGLAGSVRFCVSSVDQIAELLAPSRGDGNITQITVEPVDDLKVIQAGRNARQIVETELRACVSEGARKAAVSVDPLVRQYLTYKKLAAQIAEAKDGRTILVAHDLSEHVAKNNLEAHKMIGAKVRKLREAVENAIGQLKCVLLPITLIVTNYSLLRNDPVLDEEIAGVKWRILPGRLDDGRFVPEPENYENLVKGLVTVFSPRVSA